MIAFFNQSRVNLNFAYSSVPVNKLAKAVAKVPHLAAMLGIEHKLYRRQIKGRNFEIPGCGGLLLTDIADNIADYYKLDEEIAIAEGLKGFVRRIKQLLGDEPKRAAIAQAGYERTINEHTYVHRLNDIFKVMGLPTHDIQPPFEATPGEVTYVS
jgi:spore maturation protein CgeB